MESTRHFRFPARPASSLAPSPPLVEPHRPISSLITKSPTFSTLSALVSKKSGADGSTGETMAKIRRKISATVLPALSENIAGEETMGVASTGTSVSQISTSRSSSAIHRKTTSARRRHQIARSVTGPLTRLFNHDDHESDDDGEGWDFICAGEPPCRPDHRGSGWLGVETQEEWEVNAEAAASCGCSSPAFASPGWSPVSTEFPLESPVPFPSSSGHSLESPVCSLASPETEHPTTLPPARLAEPRGFSGLRRSKPVQTRRLKISIDTISSPIITSFENGPMTATTSAGDYRGLSETYSSPPLGTTGPQIRT